MTLGSTSLGLTLGIAPTTRGFCWIAFSGPLAIYDWGLMYARTEKALRCVRYFESLLDRLQPELIVLEEPSSEALRSKRVVELHRLLKSSGFLAQIDVATYRRDQVQSCFASVGARSQQEIADAIAAHFPELAHRAPRPRRAWHSEDRRLALFAAASLVLAHFHLQGNAITERMKSAE